MWINFILLVFISVFVVAPQVSVITVCTLNIIHHRRHRDRVDLGLLDTSSIFSGGKIAVIIVPEFSSCSYCRVRFSSEGFV